MRDDAVLHRALPLGRGLGRHADSERTHFYQSTRYRIQIALTVLQSLREASLSD